MLPICAPNLMIFWGINVVLFTIKFAFHFFIFCIYIFYVRYTFFHLLSLHANVSDQGRGRSQGFFV